MFSVLIPTWNNLRHVELCVRSLRKYSAHPHEILLHVNDGSDGTLDWARREKIPFTHSETNVGVCRALNEAAALATRDYVVFLNDDMVVLPGWDSELLKARATLPGDCFMLSSTVIQRLPSKSGCILQADYGRGPSDFREEALLKEFASLPKQDWQGSTWTPFLVTRRSWHRVGGMSIELSPGLYSDPDFARKMWMIGCRTYWGVAASRVYHFESATIQRIGAEERRRCYLTFLRKWDLPASAFDRYFTRMGEPYRGPVEEPHRPLRLWVERWKARFVGFVGA